MALLRNQQRYKDEAAFIRTPLSMVVIDKLNEQIIAALEADGRKTFAELAEQFKRPESTIRDRIQRLERAGVIRGYTAIVDKRFLGYSTEALILCNVKDPENVYRVIEALGRIENVIHIYLVSGERRIAVRLIATDNRDLEDILRRKIVPLGIVDVSLHIVTGREVGLCVKI